MFVQLNLAIYQPYLPFGQSQALISVFHFVVFPPYQVSAGASGIVRAFIPYSAIPNLICLP